MPKATDHPIVVFLAGVTAAFIAGVTAWLFVQQQVRNEITKSIEEMRVRGTFPSADSESRLKNLEQASIRVESGYADIPWGDGKSMSGKTISVRFRKAFRTTPHVVVGFTSMDVVSGGATKGLSPAADGSARTTLRVKAAVANITNEGFNFSINSWDDGLVNQGSVDWIAFETPQ